MTPDQQRYVDILEKLGRSEALSRGEQLWLFQLLGSISEMFFPAPKKHGRGRLDDRNFWMTADSLCSNDQDKIVAKRWGVSGRISNVLVTWRPRVQEVFGDISKSGVKGVIDYHRRRFVKKPQ
jgi:hypothetical protein